MVQKEKDSGVVRFEIQGPELENYRALEDREKALYQAYLAAKGQKEALIYHYAEVPLNWKGAWVEKDEKLTGFFIDQCSENNYLLEKAPIHEKELVPS